MSTAAWFGVVIVLVIFTYGFLYKIVKEMFHK